MRTLLVISSFALLLALVLTVPTSATSNERPLVYPTLAITEYPLNPGYINPGAIIRGSDNNVWFTEVVSGTNNHTIARITPAGTITDFPIPGSPVNMTAGPDGNIWYTRSDIGAVGKMTLTGPVTTYALPAGANNPYGITAGPDGNLWITEQSIHQVLRMTTNGVVTGQFAIEEPDSIPAEISPGTDGNLWFSERFYRYPVTLRRITPFGIITEFTVSSIGVGGITPDPNGNIWISLGQSNALGGSYGRVASNGTTIQFNAQWIQPGSITTGSDGNLWAVGSLRYGAGLNRITADGFVIFCQCPPAGCITITSGGDGNLWFTTASSIATVDPRSVPLYRNFFPFVSK